MKVTGRESKALFIDTANGKALAKSNYDSIIYKTRLHDGKIHKDPQLSQIIVPKNSKAIKRTDE